MKAEALIWRERARVGSDVASLEWGPFVVLLAVAAYCGEHPEATAPWRAGVAWPGRRELIARLWPREVGSTESAKLSKRVREHLAALRLSGALWQVSRDAEFRGALGFGLPPVSGDVFIIPAAITPAARDAAVVYFGSELRGAELHAAVGGLAVGSDRWASVRAQLDALGAKPRGSATTGRAPRRGAPAMKPPSLRRATG